MSAEHKRNLIKTGEALMWGAGFIALPWLKVKDRAVVDEKIDTYTVAADGVLRINPKWYAAQRPDERVFQLAASMMTFALVHHDRGVDLGVTDPATGGPMPGQEKEHGVWNRARAMVVNDALQKDAIGRAPGDAVFPPAGYKGTLDAESLYYYLLKTEPPQPPAPPQGQGGQPPPQKSPHAGGQTQPAAQPQPGKGDKADQSDGEGGPGNAPQTDGNPGGEGGMSRDDIDQMRREMEAFGRMAGTGTHCVEALKPKRERTNYRSVIGAGLDMASTESAERTRTTYARASRREAFEPEMVLPGKIGEDPSIVVVIDYSGSCQSFAQRFTDHAQKVATDYPNTKVLLVAHTDRVTYMSWLKPGGEPAKLEAASKFSGGTSFAPAYEAAKKEAGALPGGKFDVCCHFTDGQNCGAWPIPPARRLVIGLTGDSSIEGMTPLPMVAKVIPITMSVG